MRCLLICLFAWLGMTLSTEAVAASRSDAPTLIQREVSTPLSPRQQKRLERLERKLERKAARRARRGGDSPAWKFFTSLGIAIALGVLAAVFIDIAVLSLALTIAGGVAFFVALWFLIRWLYYYW